MNKFVLISMLFLSGQAFGQTTAAKPNACERRDDLLDVMQDERADYLLLKEEYGKGDSPEAKAAIKSAYEDVLAKLDLDRSDAHILYLDCKLIKPDSKKAKKDDPACATLDNLNNSIARQKNKIAHLQFQLNMDKKSGLDGVEQKKMAMQIDQLTAALSPDYTSASLQTLTCDFARGITRFKGASCPEGLEAVGYDDDFSGNSETVLCRKSDSPLMVTDNTTLPKVGQMAGPNPFSATVLLEPQPSFQGIAGAATK